MQDEERLTEEQILKRKKKDVKIWKIYYILKYRVWEKFNLVLRINTFRVFKAHNLKIYITKFSIKWKFCDIHNIFSK